MKFEYGKNYDKCLQKIVSNKRKQMIINESEYYPQYAALVPFNGGAIAWSVNNVILFH